MVSAIQISSNARLALGHTPTIYLDPQQTTPDVRDNRCNVDTGAGMSIAEDAMAGKIDHRAAIVHSERILTASVNSPVAPMCLRTSIPATGSLPERDHRSHDLITHFSTSPAIG